VSSFKDPAKPGFDEYAKEYDAALEQGLSVSGENKDYFAHGRVEYLSSRLRDLQFRPGSVLDFGCGIGTNVPFLLSLDGVKKLVGVDISDSSLEIARQKISDERATFSVLDRYLPDGQHDLVFTNGVFHHIPPQERAGAIEFIYRALRPGGLLVFWENNPWNPGTRYVMSRIPFDRDAITLNVREARSLIRAGGLEVLRSDFLFIFPKALGLFRKLEPRLAKLPFGAQYLVLCQKPRHSMASPTSSSARG
jgi:SAM-dependent methyltransferase